MPIKGNTGLDRAGLYLVSFEAQESEIGCYYKALGGHILCRCPSTGEKGFGASPLGAAATAAAVCFLC